MPDTEVVLPRRKRKPRVDKPRVGSKALDQIDTRLAEALAEKEAALTNVSKLVYWQDRLTRVNQEIESLIGYQQRLTGQTAAAIPFSSSPVVPIPWYIGAAVPTGVTSAPAKQPAPSGSNMADEIGSEVGFS